MKYIFYKKKLINGKKRRLYKKEGSNKLYLKHKGRMVNIVKYKKYLKIKQKKGGMGYGLFSRNFSRYRPEQRVRDMGRIVKNTVKNNIDTYKQKNITNKKNAYYEKRNALPKDHAKQYMLRTLNDSAKQRSNKQIQQSRLQYQSMKGLKRV